MWGWISLAIVLFVIYKVFLSYSTEPISVEPEAIEIQTFTPRTLQKYNGKDHPRILMAIKGKVYDVTMGKNHYGPGGPYVAFAGRDASRALAKHSFEEELLTPVGQPIDTLSDLSQSEHKVLDDWIEFFSSKYPYCGELRNE